MRHRCALAITSAEGKEGSSGGPTLIGRASCAGLPLCAHRSRLLQPLVHKRRRLTRERQRREGSGCQRQPLLSTPRCTTSPSNFHVSALTRSGQYPDAAAVILCITRSFTPLRETRPGAGRRRTRTGVQRRATATGDARTTDFEAGPPLTDTKTTHSGNSRSGKRRAPGTHAGADRKIQSARAGVA